MDPPFTVLGDTFTNNANKTSRTALYTCKIVIHSLIHTSPTNNKKKPFHVKQRLLTRKNRITQMLFTMWITLCT